VKPMNQEPKPAFDDAAIDALVAILRNARRKASAINVASLRADMERWAELLISDDAHPTRHEREPEPAEQLLEALLIRGTYVFARPQSDNEQDLIDELLIRDPSKRARRRRGKRTTRPRADFERYAALLLALIFKKHGGRNPKRVWDHHSKYGDDRSPFYVFAVASFRSIGLRAPKEVLRETGERWDKSHGFSKRAMKQLLWGSRTKPAGRKKAP
jgi:hypothetical protein